MNAAAVILAAGSASRYGSPKPLEWIAGETFVARAVRIASEAGFRPLFAVVHEDGVASAARGGGGEAVFNPRWEMGLASSIAAGIGRAGSDPDVDGALILACDQVVVNAEDLRRLRNAFEPGSLAVAADYGNGAFGVPAIFAREAFAALRALEGDAGAKSFLEEHRGRVRFVPMPSAALDVDRPEDIR